MSVKRLVMHHIGFKRMYCSEYIEECLQKLQRRIDVAYDGLNPEHQEALRMLWDVSFPEEELHGLISEQWKEMGWQGKDPSTDFRGAGMISLENLLFFARTYPKREGDRTLWEYPFAVAGVNITFMLLQMLDLEAVKPRTMMGAVFCKLLSENELAFDILYCNRTLKYMHGNFFYFSLIFLFVYL
ncbi:hypothetical protein ACHQM5_012098 [Ranunculus cassubicifolius]